MVIPNRPDISKLDPAIQSYIRSLETEIDRLHMLQNPKTRSRSKSDVDEDLLENLPEILEPSEEPTTINVITVTASGIAKRTPRHLYNRQLRGGMGIFDMDTPLEEPPAILVIADQSASLLLMTNMGRAFRLPVVAIPETPVRARGESIIKKLNLPSEEYLTAILPVHAEGYVAIVSQRGMVRLLRHHVFGEYMKPGTPLYELRTFGFLANACWTSGDRDMFIATRHGRAIRFPEKLVPPQGIQAIRLEEDDSVVSITTIDSDSGVFLLGSDGKGTIRLMKGFTANKAPGAGGKVAFNTNHLVSALTIDNSEDVFIISRLSKIIRFPITDIPLKDGVVQGVICMSLRADETLAVILNLNT
jgi:DNA gyrase subunit A